MKDKFIIVDLRIMDYFKDDEKNVKIFDTEEEAIETCGMYEFENCWVCKLVFNHIEPEWEL
jgi:hypothetical protein